MAAFIHRDSIKVEYVQNERLIQFFEEINKLNAQVLAMNKKIVDLLSTVIYTVDGTMSEAEIAEFIEKIRKNQE
jgi:hypothetical protein